MYFNLVFIYILVAFQEGLCCMELELELFAGSIVRILSALNIIINIIMESYFDKWRIRIL